MSVSRIHLSLVVMATLLTAFLATQAWAGECEEKLDKCFTFCTKKAFKADEPKEFPEMISLEGPCESKCFARSNKCMIKAAGKKNKSKAKKVLRVRKKMYAKLCQKRFDKILRKCQKASKDDFGKLKKCYRRKVRPEVLDCYKEIDEKNPLPGATQED